MGHMRQRARTLTLLALAAVSGGCTTMRQEYPDSSGSAVWSAMVVVARTPTYDDWEVLSNETWVDEQHQRIEIYRRLRRAANEPVARSRTERREWRLEVLLEETQPPTVAFVSHGMAVPAHAHEEAIRYFKDLSTILSAGGLSRPAE